MLFNFLVGFCFIQNLLTWKIIGLGKEKGGLFHLMLQDDSNLRFPSITVTVNASPPLPVKDVSADVWHYRLGHISHSRISLTRLTYIDCKS